MRAPVGHAQLRRDIEDLRRGIKRSSRETHKLYMEQQEKHKDLDNRFNRQLAASQFLARQEVNQNIYWLHQAKHRRAERRHWRRQEGFTQDIREHGRRQEGFTQDIREHWKRQEGFTQDIREHWERQEGFMQDILRVLRSGEKSYTRILSQKVSTILGAATTAFMAIVGFWVITRYVHHNIGPKDHTIWISAIVMYIIHLSFARLLAYFYKCGHDPSRSVLVRCITSGLFTAAATCPLLVIIATFMSKEAVKAVSGVSTLVCFLMVVAAAKGYEFW